jgi:uncharacterized membrane protein
MSKYVINLIYFAGWLQLIYDDQIERLKEKEQKDAKKRQRLGENFSDLLYSITVLQLTISMLHYLLTCKLSALIYSVWSTAVTKCLEELL